MPNSTSCRICQRIKKIVDGTNPYFVIELNTGYVVMGDYQFYKGYTVFLYKKHIGELHELDEDEKMLFLKEMSVVTEAVFKCFNPKKLNNELLGNTDHHLHWHIFPRHNNDPSPHEPIWKTPKEVRCADEYKTENFIIDDIVQRLKIEITELLTRL